MDEKRFWDIIAHSAAPEQWRQYDRLLQTLVEMKEQDIIDFHNRLWELIGRANRWDVWGAIYLSAGGCSNDSFTYFRAWLVSRGKAVYEAVLAVPDRLVEFTEPGELHRFEDLLSVAGDVWHLSGYGGQEDLWNRARQTAWPYPDTQGEDWDFDDDEEMRRRYSRLFARDQASRRTS